MTEPRPLPHPINPDVDDVEVRVLIESRRYRGAPIGWDAVVGHEPQVRTAPRSSHAGASNGGEPR